MNTVAFLNHKGGVGKTTFACIAAQGLTLAGYRVLALDNDTQHNLTSMMGLETESPDLKDVYTSTSRDARKILMKSIRKTSIENLHMVSASPSLSAGDISDTTLLNKALSSIEIQRFYDYIIIDNGPGLDMIQEQAINSADLILTPTELKQFAVDGVVEMNQTIKTRFRKPGGISWVIPNFFHSTKREKTFLSVLKKMFPSQVTETMIPRDSVLDEIVTREKILLVHRYASKASKAFLSMFQEVFDLKESDLERIYESRREYIREEARERYYKKIRGKG